MVLPCFFNQEIKLTSSGIPIEFRVPPLLLDGINALGDLSKLVGAQFLNGTLKFFDTAHRPIVTTSPVRAIAMRL